MGRRTAVGALVSVLCLAYGASRLDARAARPVLQATSADTAIALGDGVRTAWANPELVAVTQPSLGALTPGATVQVFSNPRAPVEFLAVDGVSLALTRDGPTLQATVPGDLATGVHRVVLNQRSDVGDLVTNVRLIVPPAGLQAVSAAVPVLPTRLVPWAVVRFDTSLQAQGDRSPAFTLADGTDVVRITATGSGKINEITPSGDVRPGSAAALRVAPVGVHELDRRFGSNVVRSDDGDLLAVKNPADGFWYRPDASQTTMTALSGTSRGSVIEPPRWCQLPKAQSSPS